jgi:hypothetical protein
MRILLFILLTKIMLKKNLSIPFIFSLLFAFCFEASASPPAQNEKFVIHSLRALHSAQITYNATSGNGNFGTFQNLEQANLIDSALATGLKYGYNYQIFTTVWSAGMPATLRITATPQRYRKTGRRSFYIDESGVLRGSDKNGAAATVFDPEIEYECAPREECVITSLRTLHSAQVTYAATSGNGNYASFRQLYDVSLINSTLADGAAYGYNFTYLTIDRTATTSASFKLWAVPINYGVTGIRSFYIGTDGVIYGADKNGGLADENDPPIDY